MDEWTSVPDTSTNLPKVSSPTRSFKFSWQLGILAAGLLLILGVGIFSLIRVFNNRTQAPPDIVLATAQTFTEALTGEPEFINPLLTQSQVDRDIASLVFSGLTRIDQYGLPVPDLAEDWELSPDGLTYVFTLREDVTWHDGEPFTAEDVAFTMSLLRDPNYPGPVDVGAFWRTVETYADDDYTVRFILTQPLAAFPEYAGIGVLPEHWFAEADAEILLDDPFNLDPIGTGPLDWAGIEEQRDSISVRLVPYDDYYDSDRRIQFDDVIFNIYSESQDAYASLGSDNLALGNLSAGQLDAVMQAPRLNVYTSRMPIYSAVIFNQQDDSLPFFQDQKVRSALLLSINRERLVQDVLGRQGIVIHSSVLPGTWAYHSNLIVPPYDTTQAAQLLDDAGYSLVGDVRTGESGEISFTLLVSNDETDQAIGDMLVEEWRELGIDVDVQSVPPDELLQRIQSSSRNFDAVLVEFSQAGLADPDPYPFWHQSQVEDGQNFSGFTSRTISEAIEVARREQNGVRRAELYELYQQQFLDESATLLLYNPLYHYTVSCQVAGVQMALVAGPQDRFKMMHNWRIVPADEIEQVCGG